MIPDETWNAVLHDLGACQFKEDVNDGSMCQCGLPALDHDETVIRVVLSDHPGIALLVDEALTAVKAFEQMHAQVLAHQAEVQRLRALLPEATETAEWGVWSGVSIAGPVNNWDSYQRFLSGGEGLRPTHHRTRTSYADRVTEWTEVDS